jgi:hypothetical protein
MKDRATMARCNTLMGILGLALWAWLFGFTASATALSIRGTYTDIVGGSLGTTGPIPESATGLGGPLGSIGGFPNVTTLENIFWSTALGTGVTAHGSRTRADNATRSTLNSSSKFFAQGQVGDFTTYVVTQWAGAFSSTAPVVFSLSGHDHALLFIDGKLGRDDGGVKAIGAPIATAAAFTGEHGLDLFVADAHARQSGPEPARLLLFGATLVGLGAVVRRRMRGAPTPSV